MTIFTKQKTVQCTVTPSAETRKNTTVKSLHPIALKNRSEVTVHNLDRLVK